METSNIEDRTELTVDEIYDAGKAGIVLLVLGSILELVMLGIIGLRLYTKHCILRRWTADDLTIVLATLFITAYFIVGCFVVTTAASASILAGNATDAFYISAWLTQWLSPLAFVFVKLSFFILYLEIFRPIKSIRIAAWLGVAYCTLLWTFLFFFQIIATTPKRNEPWSVVTTNWGAQVNHTLVLVAGPFDVLSDIHILVLPVLGLQTLKLSARQRLGVLAVVLTSLLALVAAVISLYYRVGYESAGQTQSSFYAVTTCVIIELQIGACCASLPAVSALLRRNRNDNKRTNFVGNSGTIVVRRHSTKTGEDSSNTVTFTKQKTTQTVATEIARTDSDSTQMDSEVIRQPQRPLTRGSRRSWRDHSPSPRRDQWRKLPPEIHTRTSRRGSLLRAASPWGMRRADSHDDDLLAALGSNILVSTEVRQETRRSSIVHSEVGGHVRPDENRIEGVRTVIESPRRVESQIYEAMTGAYGAMYSNGHFPGDPKAGWLDR